MLVNRGAMANRKDIEWLRPGEMVDLNSGNDMQKAVQQLTINDTGLSTFQNGLDYHNKHAEETMALNPNAAGMLARSRRSATESAQALEGANARFISMIKNFEHSGFTQMVRQMGQMMQQYMSGPRQFKIINPMSREEKDAIMKINPEDIQGEFTYRIRTNTTTNKDIRTQLAINTLGVLAPLAKELNMNITPLVKGIFEMMPIASQMNIDQVFPEQMPEVMNQEQPGLERMLAEGAGPTEGAGAPGAGQPIPTPGAAPPLQTMSEAAGVPLF